MKKILSLLILVALFAPLYADARLAGAECSAPQTTTSAPQTTTSAPQTTTSKTSIGLSNPVKGAPNLACFFYRIVDFVMGLSYVVIAFFLLLAGFKFVTAQGSDDKLTDAKRTFWYTIIGALILIGANTIIEIVQSIMTELQG